MSQTANMLRTLLACAERPDDMRLNPHLAETDIAETVRIAIECLETETMRHDESDRLRAALVEVSRQAFATDTPEFLGLPRAAWETVLQALGKK